MAKKTKKVELDDFGFDDGLDFPEMDFDNIDVKDNRKPVTKVAHSFLGAAKDTAISPNFIRNMVRTSLPRGYGSAIDMADQTAGSLKNLYNTTAKEIKPVINDLKRTTKRVMPTAEKYLPKAVADRVKKWADSEKKTPEALSVDAQRETGLQMQLGEIFQMQTEQANKARAEDDIKDKFKEGIDQARHRDKISLLQSLTENVQRMADYQSKITTHFQRKSLELQFRQYFVAQDMLEEQKRFSASATTFLETIQHNTALPDFVKLTKGEAFKEVMRNKFFNSLQDGFLDKRRNFIRNFTSNIGNVVKDRVGKFAGDVRQGLDATNMGLDTVEGMAEMGLGGLSPAELAGNIAGTIATESLGKRLGRRISKFTDKHDGLVRTGNKLQHFTDNLPQIAGEWAKGAPAKSKVGKFLEKVTPTSLQDFFKDVTNQSLVGPDGSLDLDNTANLMAPVPFNRQTNKSITEIIPGFLSRIFRELQIIRTGDDSIGLTTYDYDANKFSSTSGQRSNAFSKLVRGDDKNTVRTEVDELLNKIAPGQTLTEEERTALGKFLLKQNMHNRLASPERLQDYSTYADAGHSKHADKFAEVFENYFKDDSRGDKQVEFARDYNRLGGFIPDARSKIQSYANLGQLDFLRDAGVVDSSGQVDFDKLLDYHYDNSYNPSDTRSELRGTRNMGRPGRRTAGRQSPPPAAPVPAPTPAPRFDTRNITLDTQDLLAAVNDSNIKTIATTMSETLLRIEERLNQGLITLDGTQLIDASNHAGTRWWNKTFKQGARGVWDFGTDTARRAWNKIGQLQQSANNMAGHAWDTAKKGFSWAKGKIGQLNDIYVKGELLPRLQKAKIKAGDYYVLGKDGAKKVIKKLEDITGPVFDESGNLVLSMEDAKKAFVKSGTGQKLLSAITKLKDDAAWAFGKFKAQLPVAYQMGLTMAKKAYDMLLDGPQDVYVRGKPDPALLAITMKAGGYASRVTSKEIRKVSDIDGPVIDSTGNVVLTQADLAAGLLDKHGRPLRTGWRKLTGMARDLGHKALGLAKRGWDKIQKAGAWAKDKLTNGLGIGDWFKNWTAPDGVMFSGSKTMVGLLTEIRDILEHKFGKPKKHRHDEDINGDGIREGSVQDLLAKQKAKLKEKAEAAKAAGGNLYGKGKAGLLSLLSKLRPKPKDEEEEDDDDGIVDKVEDQAEDALLDKGKGWLGKATRRARVNGKRLFRTGGRFLRGKGGSLVRGGLKLGSRALPWLGRGAMALGGMGLSGIASAAGSAGGAALGLGSAALSGLGTLAAGAGAVIGGIGAVLASPVVLGAAALAALGTAGYFGYKYLTRKKLGQLSTVRYAQYGFSASDTDHLQKVFGLEDAVVKGVTWMGGTAQLDEKKVDIKDMLDKFGVDTKDQDQISSFVQWFANRFKPVFLTNVSALRAVDPQKTLADVDDLKPAEKKKFFEIAKWPDGPYNFLISPFPDLKQLPMTNSEVQELIKETSDALAKEKDTDDVKSLDGAPKAVAATAAAVTTNQVSAEANNGSTPKFAPAGVGVTLPENPDSDTSGMGSGTTVVGTFDGYTRSATGALDALTCIRYKTYGLTELVLEKVRALDMLEQEVRKNISFNASNQAQWQGDIAATMKAVAAAFGVQPADVDWMKWFMQRFLPTFLNYAGAVRAQTSKDNLEQGLAALNSQQKVDVAMATYTSKVWGITASPWPGYALNTDVDSVAPNVQALKETAKKMTLTETTGTKTTAGMGADNGTGFTNNDAPKGFLARGWDSVKKTASKVWDSIKSTASGIFGGSKDSGRTIATGVGGGTPMQALSQGSGGAIDSLPNPKGKKGTWEAVKDLILGAARMVGVDDKLMATMAAIESGFDWTVKAGTSSATGLYQFVQSTWNTMLKKYGSKYGIPPGTPPTDARANALMGAEFLRENAEALKSVGRPLTDTDLYLAHFLGAGGAKKLLTADPNAIAANVLPSAARSNAPIFYDESMKPRTVAEVYQEINRRVQSKGRQFGLDDGSQAITAGTPSNSATPASTASTGSSAVSFPVADQTPGVASPTMASTPSTAPTVSASSSTEDTNAVDPTAQGGFVPPSAPGMSRRTRTLAAQQQAQRDAMAESMGSVDTTLKQSLAVQKNQLDVLTKILGVMGTIPAPAAAAATPVASKSATTMPTPPVSMRKPFSGNN